MHVRLRVRTLVAGAAAVGLAVASLTVGGGTPQAAKPLTTLHDLQLAANSLTTGYSRYLTVPGFTGGQSTLAAHKGLALVDNVRFGMTATPSDTPGGATGKAMLDPIVIGKTFDPYSPQVAKALATGKHFATITAYVYANTSAAKGDIAKYVFTDAIFVKQSLDSTGNEVVSLTSAKVSITYTARNAAGAALANYLFCFDFRTNVGC
jgi:type VI protein secretion system component Hcp